MEGKINFGIEDDEFTVSSEVCFLVLSYRIYYKYLNLRYRHSYMEILYIQVDRSRNVHTPFIPYCVVPN